MEVTITLQYGPVDIEFTGEDREQVQGELLDFVNFIEENQESLSSLPTPSENSESEPGEEQTSATDWTTSNPGDTATDSSGVSEFQSLSAKTGVDAGYLAKLYDLPDDDEGVPGLNMYHFEDGTLRLGNARNQRQAQASALLLMAWEECLDRKRATYGELDEALIESDIETERRDAMRQAFSNEAAEWFEFETSNSDPEESEIWLVGQGKNHARELLQELAEELD